MLDLILPRAADFPRWRGLTAFGNVMSITFSDGSKYEDLSKVIKAPILARAVIGCPQQISVFIMHNLFSEKTPEYCLLRALRCYVEVDLYASLEVHTDQTIAGGRQRLTRFYELMKVGLVESSSRNPSLNFQEYMALEESSSDGEDTKNWNFPKMHSQLHIFDDIVAKGATRNYNTKTNESRHRPIKRTYVLLTNFKDVAEQVCPFDHK